MTRYQRSPNTRGFTCVFLPGRSYTGQDRSNEQMRLRMQTEGMANVPQCLSAKRCLVRSQQAGGMSSKELLCWDENVLLLSIQWEEPSCRQQ